jgi:hypothetical protein
MADLLNPCCMPCAGKATARPVLSPGHVLPASPMVRRLCCLDMMK